MESLKRVSFTYPYESGQHLGGYPIFKDEMLRRIGMVEQKIKDKFPRTEFMTISHKRTNFLCLTEADSVPVTDNYVDLPSAIIHALDFINGLDPRARMGYCGPRSVELTEYLRRVAPGAEATVYEMGNPYTENIRGPENTGYDHHAVVGIQADGVVAYIDPSWPYVHDEEEKRDGMPYGIIVLARESGSANAIMHQVYGVNYIQVDEQLNREIDEGK